MPVQRKIFRIEEQARPHASGPVVPVRDDAADKQRHSEFMTELQSLRALIEPRHAMSRESLERARAQVAEAQAFKRELGLIYAAVERSTEDLKALAAGGPEFENAARPCRELAAIVGGTEQATQAILQAAEDIDQAANTLSAGLKNMSERGLAHDIRDRVVQIFEACNFQDLAGQRAASIAATLKFIEVHMARLMEIWGEIDRFDPVVIVDANDKRFLHGPMLPGDSGHSSQNDIDVMFR